MREITDIEDLLYAFNHGSDNIKLKVVRNKNGNITWRESKGTVTIKLLNQHTYTVSKQTYDKIRNYLY